MLRVDRVPLALRRQERLAGGDAPPAARLAFGVLIITMLSGAIGISIDVWLGPLPGALAAALLVIGLGLTLGPPLRRRQLLSTDRQQAAFRTEYRQRSLLALESRGVDRVEVRALRAALIGDGDDWRALVLQGEPDRMVVLAAPEALALADQSQCPAHWWIESLPDSRALLSLETEPRPRVTAERVTLNHAEWLDRRAECEVMEAVQLPPELVRLLVPRALPYRD